MSRSELPAAPSDGGRSEEIPGLLGLRAVMGTWVVADHLRDWMISLLPSLAPLRPVLSGGIALDTFFIMSGFVIAHVYARGLATFDRRAYGTFLWARVARLWPTHVFALGIAGVVAACYGSASSGLGGVTDYSVGTFLGNLAMLQAVPGVDAWNAPSWSVSTEMCAYLLFPSVAAVVVRARRAGAVALAVAVVATMMLVLPHLYAGSPATFFAGLMWVRPSSEIVLGAALWAVRRYGIGRHWCWDLVVVGALGGVALIAYSGRSGATALLAVALLAVLVVAVTGAAGPVHRLLDARAMRWAGRTSYSRYLLHVPVLFAFQLVLPSEGVEGAPRPVRAAVVLSWFVVVFAAGGLAHRFVEEPARRRMRRRGAPPRPEATGPATGGASTAPDLLPGGETRALPAR